LIHPIISGDFVQHGELLLGQSEVPGDPVAGFLQKDTDLKKVPDNLMRNGGLFWLLLSLISFLGNQ
jgi:hypothetical protein